MEELDFLKLVRRLVIVALFSDDELMERLVLKGGNLLDLAYGVSTRSSTDVDLSIDGDFGSLDDLKIRVRKVLSITFGEHGYIVFDVTLTEEPPPRTNDAMKDFWGGYRITFKLADEDTFKKYENDPQRLRQRAKSLGQGDSKPFKIDISKHEYCDDKQSYFVDDVSVYGYSPAMTVAEKLRAICQQMPEYAPIIGRKNRGGALRARDFLDIYMVADKYSVDFDDEEFRQVVRKVFDVKRVPLELIGKIESTRDFHSHDFAGVEDTVYADVEIKDFDFYFDFVLEKVAALEALWHK